MAVNSVTCGVRDYPRDRRGDGPAARLRYVIPFLVLFGTSTSSNAQQTPNLGDKVCGLWTAVIDKAKSDSTYAEQVSWMDWWSLGFLKGIGTQYSATIKGDDPLRKLRNNEEIDWMRAYCRINRKMSISDAATALFEELKNRP